MNTAPIVEFVQRVVDAMDLDLTATAEEEADGIRINLDGDDGWCSRAARARPCRRCSRSSARRSAAIATTSAGWSWTVNGYRRDKDAELHQMAAFLAEKAKSTGLAQEMGPLNPYERRIVHMAVAGGRVGDLREHRRRVREDGHHLGEVAGATAPQASRVFSTDDTIVAVATPAGRGGVAVARLSGPGRPRHRPRPRRPHAAAGGAAGDPGAAHRPRRSPTTRCSPSFRRRRPTPARTWWRSRPTAARWSMAAVVAAATGRGARAARPGEFTLRAFLNGKLDLLQAEAVHDLVEAVSPAEARLAAGHLDGGLSAAVARLAATLRELHLRLEASIDFPDEGYHFIDRDATAAALRATCATSCTRSSTARHGRGGCATGTWWSWPARRTSASRASSTRWSATSARSSRRSPGRRATW